MGRRERRIFKINDELMHLRDEIRLTEEELRVHRHLDDDAQRDAAVGGPLERDDARVTAADVGRFHTLLALLHARVEKLEAKRTRLLARLR